MINALQRSHDTYSPIKLLKDQSEMNPNHKQYLQLSIFNFPLAGFSIEGGTRLLIAAYFVFKSLFFALF